MLTLALTLLATAQTPPAPAPKSDLTVTLAAPGEVVLNTDLQVDVTLANAADKEAEVAELQFEERSVSFEITLDLGNGKSKAFIHAVTRPDPHLVDRLSLPRVAIGPKRSLSAPFRIPTLRSGSMTIIAKYAGAGAPLRSAPMAVKVKPQAEGESRVAAEVETTLGRFRIDLAAEEAPNSVAGFVALARRGYFDNMTFHGVVKNSLLRSGCPYGNGWGGPGYAVKSEAREQTLVHLKGTVSLSGSLKLDYTGSQFFITLSRVPSFDKKFTVIGQVPEADQETLAKIGSVEVDKSTDKPLKDVLIRKITIVAVK